MTLQTVGIRVAYWVQEGRWPELRAWLASHSNDSLTEKQLLELTKRLQSSEPRVFLDGTSLSEMYLGQVTLQPEEFLPDLVVQPRVIGVLWGLQDFLLEFVLDGDLLGKCTEKQRELLVQAFGPYLQALLKESLTSPPEYVNTVCLCVDDELIGIDEDSGIPPYLDNHFVDGAGVADVYWSGGETPALFLWTPQTLSQPAHILISSSTEILRLLLQEIEHLIWHEVLRKAISREIDVAESEARRALALRNKLGQLSASPLSVPSLLASLGAPSSDLPPELSRSIVDLNEATQRLQDKQATLRQIRTVYEEDLFWRGDTLILFRTRVARGRLVKITEGDIGQLSLGSYLRRSALQILEFYDRCIDEARERLKGLLDSYQTLLEVRSTQQSDLLNRLVLILALVSAFLAMLQVLSAFDFWTQDGRLLILAGAMLVLALIIQRLVRAHAARRQS